MEVYFGGAYQGKLDYVCSKKNMSVVADGADCNIEDLENAEILNHMHQLIKRYVKEGKSTDTLIDSLYDINPEIIIICDEVGSGIVPLEKEDRIYREAVGRVLCSAVKKAVHVERVICGIGQCLKGGQ